MEPTDLASQIKAVFTDEIRPRVRVDGGDVQILEIKGDSVVVAALADCSVCPATDECLKHWIQQEIKRATGQDLIVVFQKIIPYYT